MTNRDTPPGKHPEFKETGSIHNLPNTNGLGKYSQIKLILLKGSKKKIACIICLFEIKDSR